MADTDSLTAELMTEEEGMELIMALAETRGDKGFTEEEALVLHKWAVDVLVQHSLYTMVLSGDVNVDVRDGEPVFGVTEQGARKVETMNSGGIVH